MRSKGNLSRRGFLGRTLAALVCAGCSNSGHEAGLPEWFARELTEAADEASSRQAKSISPNDRIRLGVIGLGTRGGGMSFAVKIPGVEFTAICDVDAQRRENALPNFGKQCGAYSDFRELLARKDVDAVIIATPDHWHALIALAAMKAGKDVYCEKPLALTIAEGQALRQAARATGRVFQVGSQQRSNDQQFRLACELVRNGRLGKLKTIRTLIGSNPTGGPFPEVPVPPELDWNLWLGPAPLTPYVTQRCHNTFRSWYEYAGGKLTDWGAHHNDIAQWALDMDESGPVAVEAKGEKPSSEPNCYNCHPTFEVTYKYANGVKLICNSDSNGVRFEGEDGWLFVARARMPLLVSKPKLIESPLPADAVRLEFAPSHMENFIDCVRSRKRPICDVEVGHRSATVCHLGVIALRTGEKLRWDPVAEKFIENDGANRWLSREMRAPWKLEV
jgi:predicted dehydrogenase